MHLKAARIAGTGVAALASLAFFAGPASAQPSQSAGAPVFVQTDNLTANTIVAYSRGADGSLTQQGSYATGGRGGQLGGSVVDHLGSQGSLTYDGAHSLLYAVNAGSNTVTVFAVHGDRLIRRQVVSSGGSFPVSVAVHGDLVYVLNALDGGSVQGFVNVNGSLPKVESWHRSLGLDPDATPQFTHTPGQIGFTPDGSKLVVTTKAGSNSIDVFPVGPRGAISAEPVVTAAPDAVPYGFAFDAAGRLVVTEAGPNAVATYTVGGNASLTKVSEVATGQVATCWVVRDGAHFYAADAGSDTLTGLQDTDGNLNGLGDTSTAGGPVDEAVTSDGQFLYVQTGATGEVDGFHVNADGSLTKAAAVTVPGAAGGEGIVAL
jgi:6-phosphogluconolactonase (cycloisomerase 2 family)